MLAQENVQKPNKSPSGFGRTMKENAEIAPSSQEMVGAWKNDVACAQALLDAAGLDLNVKYNSASFKESELDDSFLH